MQWSPIRANCNIIGYSGLYGLTGNREYLFALFKAR